MDGEVGLGVGDFGITYVGLRVENEFFRGSRQ